MTRPATALLLFALGMTLTAPAAAADKPVAEGARAVVQAIVRAARRNAARPRRGDPRARPPYRLAGDALTTLYFREAATAARRLPAKHAATAYLVALGVGLDDSSVLRKNPVTSKLCHTIESDKERKARLAVLGSPTLHNRRDWAQHFVVSCALTEIVGATLAEQIGVLKEEYDMLPGGSGFSFADLAADLAGIDFALRLKHSEISLKAIQEQFQVMDFVPPLKDLREGLTLKQFARNYGSTPDKRFRAAVGTLRKRIEALPGRKKPDAKRKEAPPSP